MKKTTATANMNRQIASRVSAASAAEGLTIPALAREVGASRRQVRRELSGRRPLPLEHVVAIAARCNRPFESFLVDVREVPA